MQMLGANVPRQPRPEKIERLVNRFDVFVVERGEGFFKQQVQFRMIVGERKFHPFSMMRVVVQAAFYIVHPVRVRRFSAPFHLDCLWEQNIVFQMNMLVHIFFKFF